MAQQIPIVVSEILNLANPPYSVAPDNIKFGFSTLESDKYITVCENAQQQIAIVDLTAGNTMFRQKMSAKAAIMNPVSKVIAVRAGQVLQIFNLELRAKMKNHIMPAPVTYWRWISPNTIALVTAQSVFHWSIEGDSAPVKIFDRNSGLTDGTQIINYQVSGDGKWCLLCGISAGATPGVINGTMQLFSIDKQVSQMLEGHSGAFTVLNIPGRDEPAQVLAIEGKTPDQPAKIFIMEVGRDRNAPGGVFKVAPQNIPMPADAANDFPVTMNASKTSGMLYMISKMGYFYLFDIFSGKPVYRARVTTDTVFASTEHTATGGVLCITRKGQVLQIGLNDAMLVPYIVGQLRDSQLAIELASRLNLPGADGLYAYTQQFNTPIAGCQCAACYELQEAYHRREAPTPQSVNVHEGRNNATRTVRRSFDSYHQRRYLHYCGANVGQSGYHQPCSRCDGRCGPTSSCQCRACHALDEEIAQRQQRLGLGATDVFRNQIGHECQVSFCPPSLHGTSGYKFFCGRRVGRERYQPQIPSCRCDGVCSPSNGCQCSDCFALD